MVVSMQRRVITLVVASLFMVLLGSLYAFSSFSRDLQAFGFNDVPSLGSYGNMGAYCGALLTGRLLDALGSRRMTLVAITLATGGWLGLRYSLLAPASAPIALSLTAIGLAGSTGYMAASAACYALFKPSAAGRVHGLLLAAYSLSAVVWAPVYARWFAGKGVPLPGSAAVDSGITLVGLPGYAYLMALFSLAVGSLTAAVVVNHKAYAKAEQRADSAAVVDAVAACNCSAEQDGEGPSATCPVPAHAHSHPSRILFAGEGAKPAGLHIKTSSDASTGTGASTAASGSAVSEEHDHNHDESTPLPQGEVRPSDHHRDEQRRETTTAHHRTQPPPAPFEGYPLSVLLLPCLARRQAAHSRHSRHQDDEEAANGAGHTSSAGGLVLPHGGPTTQSSALLGSAVLYAQFVAAFTCIGGALVFLNNISLSLHAAVPPEQDAAQSTNDLVSNSVLTFAIANTVTRLVGGWAVDALAARGWSRLSLYALSAAGVMGGLVTVSRAPVEGMLAAAALVGMGDGAAFCVFPCTVLDLYGRLRYGQMFAFVNSALGFGSLALAAMASANYRAHGSESPGGKVACHDTAGACYAQTWAFTAGLVGLVGGPCIALLYWHDRARRRAGTLTGPAASSSQH